ncbi:hypothetical protein EIP91_003584 [Steccherinum ochraceum]|uniref:F-box domain-containing protein n=1 Tax=Steccherinum ochraceum TaxID=92696 RepID=A0A4R0RCT9_9APHY|nr:hypothetical protein EIP91_003584 [Steccherinum ochraceum]
MVASVQPDVVIVSRSLDQLPSELLEAIFLYLDLLSILRCRRVSTRLDECILFSTRLQYRIELAGSSLRDGCVKSSTSDRLTAVRRRRKAWDTLSFSTRKVVSVISAEWKILCGCHIAWTHSPGHLTVMQIPSAIRNIPEKSWTMTLDGTNPGRRPSSESDLVMDPDQDLIIYFDVQFDGEQCDLMFRSLSSGEAHPAAARANLQYAIYFSYHLEGSNGVQIYGDYVAIHLQKRLSRYGELVDVYNWKKHLPIFTAKEEIIASAFLANRYLLLVHDGVGSPITLSVIDMRIVEKRTIYGTPHIRNIEMDLPVCDLKPLCQFQLPEKRGPYVASSIVLQTQTAQARTLPVPFRITNDRLLSMHIVYDGPQREEMTFIVPVLTIMNGLLKSSATRRTTFTWDEWGPQGCRLFRSDFGLDCHVNGLMACMRPLPPPDALPSDEHSVRLLLYDFSPLAARRCKEESQEQSTTYWHSSIFKSEEIVTRLPGRRKEIVLDLDKPVSKLESVCIDIRYRRRTSHPVAKLLKMLVEAGSQSSDIEAEPV